MAPATCSVRVAWQSNFLTPDELEDFHALRAADQEGHELAPTATEKAMMAHKDPDLGAFVANRRDFLRLLGELCLNYASGTWVAVLAGKVVASAPNMLAVTRALRQAELLSPDKQVYVRRIGGPIPVGAP